MHVEYVVVGQQPQAQPQPQPQPRQAVRNQELLKVTVEVLDLAEQVLEKEQDRPKIGVGKEPNMGLYGGKGHKNLSVSFSLGVIKYH